MNRFKCARTKQESERPACEPEHDDDARRIRLGRRPGCDSCGCPRPVRRTDGTQVNRTSQLAARIAVDESGVCAGFAVLSSPVLC